MAERDYKAIGKRMEEAWNSHDARAVAQLYSQDATSWDPSVPEPMRGRKAIEEYVGAMMRAFPDMKAETVTALGAGDSIATEFVVRGTHTGPLVGPQGEIPPTGRRAEILGCSIGNLNAEGLIAEERTYWDLASLMQQLGLMPPP